MQLVALRVGMIAHFYSVRNEMKWNKNTEFCEGQVKRLNVRTLSDLIHTVTHETQTKKQAIAQRIRTTNEIQNWFFC